MGMPTLADALAALDGIGLPCTQFEWPGQDAPPLPYAVLVPQDEDVLAADGVNALWCVPYDIELYSRERDVPLELRVKRALADEGIQSARSFAHDPDRHFVITYFHVTLTEQEA